MRQENSDHSMNHFAIQVSRELGELVGKIESLTNTVETLNTTFVETNRILDDRLRKNEKDISNIALKMSLLGFLAGGAGSFLMSIILKIIFK